MLFNVIKAVILLSFLMALVLEVIVGYILIRADIAKKENSPKPVKKPLSVRKILNQRKESKERAKEIKRYETLMSNIDAYDGTDFGQKDLD